MDRPIKEPMAVNMKHMLKIYAKYPLFKYTFNEPFDFDSLLSKGVKYLDQLIGLLFVLYSKGIVTCKQLITLEMISLN